jgi:glutaredoxin
LLLISSVVIQAELLSTGEDVDAFVQKKIASVDVMVFAKSYCPYCRHTRSLLQEAVPSGVSVDIIDMDQFNEDGPLIQMELMTTTGQRTVPNIFINGETLAATRISPNCTSRAICKKCWTIWCQRRSNLLFKYIKRLCVKE